MKALVHVGLGLLLLLAPALCCCQTRWVTGRADAAPVAPAAPAPACPHCAAEAPAPASDTPDAPARKPAPVNPHCVYCDGQASAIPTEPQPQPEAPAFAGEWLPVLGFLPAVVPSHPAFSTGLFPSERTGVDARSAALFDRHVMRC